MKELRSFIAACENALASKHFHCARILKSGCQADFSSGGERHLSSKKEHISRQSRFDVRWPSNVRSRMRGARSPALSHKKRRRLLLQFSAKTTASGWLPCSNSVTRPFRLQYCLLLLHCKLYRAAVTGLTSGPVTILLQ